MVLYDVIIVGLWICLLLFGVTQIIIPIYLGTALLPLFREKSALSDEVTEAKKAYRSALVRSKARNIRKEAEEVEKPEVIKEMDRRGQKLDE